MLIAISMALILSAFILLETTEKKKKAFSRSPREKGCKGGKAIHCTNQFMIECRLLLKSLHKSCLILNAGLWIYSLFAPLQYVQGYLWIIMLICSVTLFSQMGCRKHENSLTECFVTIKFSLVRQMVYSYLWGTVIIYAFRTGCYKMFYRTEVYMLALLYCVFAFYTCIGVFFRRVFQVTAGI